MDKNQFNHIEDINQEQLQQVLDKLKIYHRKSSQILAASSATQAEGKGIEGDKIIDHPLIIQKRQTTTQILTDVMSKYRKEILWYLKAKFIYEEILQPIQSEQCLILSDQTNIQFMYLGYQRSLNFLYLSESSFKNSENLHIETNYLVSSIQSLLLKVKNQFDRYFKMLTLKEGTFWSTIWTWSSALFDSKSKQRRDIIFCGFEGLDFSPSEQIAYTQQFYIPIIHERISKVASSKKKLLAKILNYQNILETDCSHIASFDDFENIKESIVSKAIESI